MKKTLYIFLYLIFNGCASFKYDGDYKNQFGHILKIKDSTFTLISNVGVGNGEYFSEGLIIKKRNFLLLVNGKIDTTIVNMFEIDENNFRFKVKSRNTLSNKTYKFKRK